MKQFARDMIEGWGKMVIWAFFVLITAVVLIVAFAALMALLDIFGATGGVAIVLILGAGPVYAMGKAYQRSDRRRWD